MAVFDDRDGTHLTGGNALARVFGILFLGGLASFAAIATFG